MQMTCTIWRMKMHVVGLAVLEINESEEKVQQWISGMNILGLLTKESLRHS